MVQYPRVKLGGTVAEATCRVIELPTITGLFALIQPLKGASERQPAQRCKAIVLQLFMQPCESQFFYAA